MADMMELADKGIKQLLKLHLKIQRTISINKRDESNKKT